MVSGVERIRTGTISDPSVRQVAALASVFRVEPSYLLHRGNRRCSMKSLCRRYRMRMCEHNPREFAPTSAYHIGSGS